MNEKVIFQKCSVVKDGIANHRNEWTEDSCCFATIGGEGLASSREAETAGTVVEDVGMTVTVRYCKKTAGIRSVTHRILFRDQVYDIVSVDHLNYKKKCLKFTCRKVADVIMEGLEEYAQPAADDMKKAVKKAGTQARKDIQENAPVKTGAYAKSWAVKTTKETANAMEIVVHSRNRYQLAHLLEFGHALRKGGRTRAFPHIAPAEERAAQTLEREVEKALR